MVRILRRQYPADVTGLESAHWTKMTLLDSGKVSGELTLDRPDQLRQRTRIEMRSPKISLSDSSLSSLLTGNTLELIRVMESHKSLYGLA